MAYRFGSDMACVTAVTQKIDVHGIEIPGYEFMNEEPNAECSNEEQEET